ncbi:TPA_asm: hypothetical protein HUJ06_031999 [Nelumbo nucifera]|uniref:Uncharacterized protein n=1 Tax=Nelumbo nucifera TaxID=4432 RepID=A0A822ZGX2_NELNU|nr:TPA_asm: hypothetical protein HUJ06_012919 [Nelumbo nucifera]DAD43863.1 TPA_asm: hypothetical protein HUJ06_002093 [Nelumbo nucifera]DAD49249.1 TPA_asm: hypothetical protein HUJ06_031991 [Nelumbo nucifera]DAD49257.1 TPA_asm: hypothetical protein HUJ06_031999 [Nelumbo nucifera]
MDQEEKSNSPKLLILPTIGSYVTKESPFLSSFLICIWIPIN